MLLFFKYNANDSLESNVNPNVNVYNEQKARLRKDRKLFAMRTDKRGKGKNGFC